jgi:hypothetical protein
MIVGRFATTCRAAFALILFAASTAAQALTSSAVFAYSGIAPSDTRLELVTNTGVYTLDPTSRGWVDPLGDNNGASISGNYIAGLCGDDDSCDGSPDHWRNWMAFSLVTTAFSTITSANLLLYVPDPGGGDQGVYASLGDPTYTLWDVTQPVGNFTGGAAGSAEFNDLGSGVAFGSRVYSLADQGTTTTVALNAAAVAYLNANMQNTVVLGGAVTPIPVQAPLAVPATSPAMLALIAVLLAAAAVVGLRRRARL